MEPDGGEVRAACEQQASCRAHGSAGLSQLPWRKTPGPEVCLPRFSPAVPPANHTRPQSHLMRLKYVSSPCKTQHGCGSHPNAPQHLGEAADRSHHLEHTVQPRCVTQWEPALNSVQGKEVTHLKQLKAANPRLASPQGQVSSCPHCSTPPATCLQPLALAFPCIQAACTSIPAPTPFTSPAPSCLEGTQSSAGLEVGSFRCPGNYLCRNPTAPCSLLWGSRGCVLMHSFAPPCC